MPNHAQRYRNPVVEFACWLADGPVAVLRWLAATLLTMARWSVDFTADLLHGGRPTTIGLAERAARAFVLALSVALLVWGVIAVVGS